MAGSTRARGGSAFTPRTALVGVLVLFALFIAYQSMSGSDVDGGSGGGARLRRAVGYPDAATTSPGNDACAGCPQAKCDPCPAAVPSLGCPRPPPCPTPAASSALALPDGPSASTPAPAAECPACAACPVCEQCKECPVCPKGAAADEDDDVDYPVVEKAPDTSYVFDLDFSPRDPLNIIYLHSPFHWPWHLDHWLRGVSRPIRCASRRSTALARTAPSPRRAAQPCVLPSHVSCCAIIVRTAVTTPVAGLAAGRCCGCACAGCTSTQRARGACTTLSWW